MRPRARNSESATPAAVPACLTCPHSTTNHRAFRLALHELLKSGAGGWWIRVGKPSGPIHVAFSTADRATVDQFHSAAVKAGAQDNGAPDLRPEYHPTYYRAFVIDPDGNNVEAVCHLPE